MPVWFGLESGLDGFPWHLRLGSVQVVMTRLPCPSCKTASVSLHASSNFPNWFASRRQPHLVVSGGALAVPLNSSNHWSVYPVGRPAAAGRTIGWVHRMQISRMDERARTRIKKLFIFV